MFINQNKYNNHSFFMKLALQQAYKSLGNTSLNPAVGCVIIKENHVISAGYTSIFGRPHAERNAISWAKSNLKDSHLYVTLEPCSHFGKTPPCVNEIIKKKIKKVYFSITDPDTRSSNKSINRFKKNKIQFSKGLLANEINRFYKSYIKSKKNELPYVTAKIALSKDLYSKDLKKNWISNVYSRGRVHLMRSNHDCILTSSKTVIADNPMLTCRVNGLEKTSPSRIILDKNLNIPVSSNIIQSAKKYKTIIFYNKDNFNKIKRFKEANVKLIKLSLNKNNEFNLKNILLKIKLLGFSRIFLESGMELMHNFLTNKLIDVFQLFISNKKLGKNGDKSFKKCMKYLNNKKVIKNKVNLLGDRLISFKIK